MRGGATEVNETQKWATSKKKKGWEPMLSNSGIQPGVRVPPGAHEDILGGM
jgi:hypothetical protein